MRLFRTFKTLPKRAARAASWAQALLLSAGVAFSPISQALELELKSTLKVRKLIDSEMERVAILAKGSRVRIPDIYKKTNAKGEVDPELTLNNWLISAGQMGSELKNTSGVPSHQTFDGERSDFFFPVEITHVASGSDVNGMSLTELNKDMKYMALSKLAREGALLVVKDSAKAHNAPPNARTLPQPLQSVGPLSNESPSLEAATCASEACAKRSQSNAIDAYIKAVQPALAAARKNSCKAIDNSENKLRYAENQLKKTCGFSMQQFMPEVKRQAQEAGVPAELLTSVMVQESAGECFILNSEANTSQSVGLFQVNTVAAKNTRRCTHSEKQTLRGMSIEKLRKGPRCLENPLVNLSEAIRIFKANMNTILQPKVRTYLCVQAKGTSGKRGCAKTRPLELTGFNPERLKDSNGNWTETAWRLAASAYNGGPAWVLRAKRDLETFNAKHGTQLSPYNWEDLRVFYLRRHLDRHSGGHQRFFGDNLTGRRVDFAIINLTYAENLVPRDQHLRECKGSSLRERVTQRLAANG